MPEKIAKTGTNQPFGHGRIKQTGQDFSRRIRLELPDKTIQVLLKPSPIKQYDTILTSEGPIPSTVGFFEVSTRNGTYYLATINKRFHNLLMVEHGQFYTIEQTSDSLFSYQNITPDSALTRFCGFTKLTEDVPILAANRNARLASGCVEFPMGFVCDYTHYQFFKQDVGAVEADNLLKLAAAQEIWGPYIFNANIVFKSIGHFIYTTPTTSPWTVDNRQNMFAIWGSFHNGYEKPPEWQRYKSLIIAGISGINYGATEIDKLTWGVGGGAQNEQKMGTLFMKGFLGYSQSRWLFAHELGHVFGASHDTDNTYVMSGDYPYVSSLWSLKSRDAVNATLVHLEGRKLLNECPVITLSYTIQKDSLELAWQTNYDSINDSFTVDYSLNEGKTWTSFGQLKSTNSFSYTYRFVNKLPLGQVTNFRIRQWGFNSLTSNVITVGILGVDNALTNAEAVVYPNPVSNLLTLKSPNPTGFTVYDLTGKLVDRISVVKKQHSIDTSRWSSGIYLIQLDANPSKVYKVVK